MAADYGCRSSLAVAAIAGPGGGPRQYAPNSGGWRRTDTFVKEYSQGELRDFRECGYIIRAMQVCNLGQDAQMPAR